MKLTKNKKGGEGTTMPYEWIIAFIILAALVLFVFFWYSGLGSKIIQIGNSFLK